MLPTKLSSLWKPTARDILAYECNNEEGWGAFTVHNHDAQKPNSCTNKLNLNLGGNVVRKN